MFNMAIFLTEARQSVKGRKTPYLCGNQSAIGPGNPAAQAATQGIHLIAF
jgi:hypothetical protein